MSITDIRERVEAIREAAADAEVAHTLEDNLFADVLQAIADGDIYGARAAKAARLALSTADIEFARWCA